jgi:hypothetical protein
MLAIMLDLEVGPSLGVFRGFDEALEWQVRADQAATFIL